jgi:hypothetical protein
LGLITILSRLTFIAQIFTLEPKKVGIMKLRTDTVGHFENPTKSDIRSAISYPDENAAANDIVKLMIDDSNFLCIWIGEREVGHTLEINSKNKKITCSEKIDSETAIQRMTQYLNGDVEWVKGYSWGESISNKFLKNLKEISGQTV